METSTTGPDEEAPLRYRVHGLTLESAIPLPELPPAEPPAEVRVGLGPVRQRPDELDDDGAGVWVGDGSICHYRREAGAFLVTGGREILVDPTPGAPDEVLRLGILGPALGLILQQRGVFAFHGSAVAMHGGAVVFVGPGGSGKSTLAALLHARGHALLSDDVSAVEIGTEGSRIIPSFPQIKLWPDSAEAILGGADELPILHPDFDKRAHRTIARWEDHPAPLRALYLLQVDQRVGIDPLAAGQALRVIMKSWYGARFGPRIFEALDQRAHLERCARLASHVPVRVLRRPGSLDSPDRGITALEEAILADLDALRDGSREPRARGQN